MPYRKWEPGEFTDAIIEELVERIAAGESMRAICADKRMPDRETIRNWSERDDDLSATIARAREVGFHERAEKAVQDAKEAGDAALGRLAFDAERWYLGKLSRAFNEKPVIKVDVEGSVKVDAADGFGKLASALERAAAAISSGTGSSGSMVGQGEAGPDSTSG